eukprot:g990.t1
MHHHLHRLLAPPAHPSMDSLRSALQEYPYAAEELDEALRTPLHWLCANEYISTELLAEYIAVFDDQDTQFRKRCPTNVPDRSGCTPLHILAANEAAATVDMIRILVSAPNGRAALTMRDSLGETPLLILCRRNSRAAELLSGFQTAQPGFANDNEEPKIESAICELSDSNCWGALHWLSYNGLCTVSALRILSEEIRISISSVDERTPLHWICLSGGASPEIFEEYMACASGMEAATMIDASKRANPLHYLCMSSMATAKCIRAYFDGLLADDIIEIVALSKDSLGWTPLHHLCNNRVTATDAICEYLSAVPASASAGKPTPLTTLVKNESLCKNWLRDEEERAISELCEYLLAADVKPCLMKSLDADGVSPETVGMKHKSLRVRRCFQPLLFSKYSIDDASAFDRSHLQNGLLIACTPLELIDDVAGACSALLPGDMDAYSREIASRECFGLADEFVVPIAKHYRHASIPEPHPPLDMHSQTNIFIEIRRRVHTAKKSVMEMWRVGDRRGCYDQLQQLFCDFSEHPYYDIAIEFLPNMDEVIATAKKKAASGKYGKAAYKMQKSLDDLSTAISEVANRGIGQVARAMPTQRKLEVFEDAEIDNITPRRGVSMKATKRESAAALFGLVFNVDPRNTLDSKMNSMGIQERVDALRQVAEAVQYVHERGLSMGKMRLSDFLFCDSEVTGEERWKILSLSGSSPIGGTVAPYHVLCEDSSTTAPEIRLHAVNTERLNTKMASCLRSVCEAVLSHIRRSFKSPERVDGDWGSALPGFSLFDPDGRGVCDQSSWLSALALLNLDTVDVTENRARDVFRIIDANGNGEVDPLELWQFLAPMATVSHDVFAFGHLVQEMFPETGSLDSKEEALLSRAHSLAKECLNSSPDRRAKSMSIILQSELFQDISEVSVSSDHAKMSSQTK